MLMFNTSTTNLSFSGDEDFYYNSNVLPFTFNGILKLQYLCSKVFTSEAF
jgi:hypothetical protein